MKTGYYFSLVTDRISELKSRLHEVTLELEDLEDDNVRLRDKLILERDILNAKIKYLKDLELLPLYISISSLSEAEILEMETKRKISFSTLLSKLGIDKVEAIVKSKKAVTLGYLKEAFLEDYDSMLNLIELQGVNFRYRDRICSLYNSNEKSLQQLVIQERRLNRVIDSQNKVISMVLKDYDILTIKEIKKYLKNPDDKLSKDFILKHKDKILEVDPSMEKVINKLTGKERFGFISRFLPKKRNKNEKKCLEKIVEAYSKDSNLKSLGVDKPDNIFELNGNMLKKFIKKLDKAITFKRNEVNEIKNNINNTRETTLSEVKSLESTKNAFKAKFSSLIHSKSSFIPKMFEEQLWNENGLRESLVRTACISEEKALISTLESWKPSVSDIQSLETDENISRKLTA